MSERLKENALGMDGGGIRGLLDALLLRELERITNKLTSEHFKNVAGTSAGSLNGAAVAAQIPAEDIVKMWINESPGVFVRDYLCMLKSGLQYQYDSRPFENIVRNIVGKRTLNDLSMGVLFPTVRFDNGDLINLVD